MTPLLINEKETSEILNVSVSKLQKSRSKSSTLIEDGKLPPYVKLDGKVLYVKEEVYTFVRNLTRFAAGGRKFEPSIEKTPESHVIQKTELQKVEEKPLASHSEIPDELMSICDFLN